MYLIKAGRDRDPAPLRAHLVTIKSRGMALLVSLLRVPPQPNQPNLLGSLDCPPEVCQGRGQDQIPDPPSDMCRGRRQDHCQDLQSDHLLLCRVNSHPSPANSKDKTT